MKKKSAVFVDGIEIPPVSLGGFIDRTPFFKRVLKEIRKAIYFVGDNWVVFFVLGLLFLFFIFGPVVVWFFVIST